MSAGRRGRLFQLLCGVNDRRVEVSLVVSEHTERLVAIAEEGAKAPRQLDSHESEQHRPRPHDGQRLPRVNPALFADDAEPLMQGVHAEQSGDARDRDVQEVLEIVIGAGNEEVVHL